MLSIVRFKYDTEICFIEYGERFLVLNDIFKLTINESGGDRTFGISHYSDLFHFSALIRLFYIKFRLNVNIFLFFA